MWKRLILSCFCFFLLSCSFLQVKTHSLELTCFTWGQATCEICDPIKIVDETGAVVETVDNQYCPYKTESKGLSDNGVKAIVTTITELPVKIIQAIITAF